MSEAKELHDQMALACECGSVRFCLLFSGKIECQKCGARPGTWVGYEEEEVRNAT